MNLSAITPRPSLDAPAWAIRLCSDIVDWVQAKGRGPQKLTRYTVATLPTLTSQDAGAMAWVTDDSTGAQACWWTGTLWQRADLTTVA